MPYDTFVDYEVLVRKEQKNGSCTVKFLHRQELTSGCGAFMLFALFLPVVSGVNK